MTTRPLHPDCIGCLQRVEPLSDQDPALVLLAMLMSGSTIEKIYQNLCFSHRRLVDDTVKEINKR